MKLYKKIASVTLLTLCVVSVNLNAKDEAGQNHDYRTFYLNQGIEYGNISDSYNADLTIYVAGNQFMAMEELIHDFQTKNPDIKKIYLETIPPGQILKGQILKQGSINGIKTAQNPDLFASVNLGHLQKLKKKEIMNDYMIYTHNKLELMVAQGNPKNIKGPQDLANKNIVKSLPNPLTEGIFKFYGSAMLKKLGIYEAVTANKQCKGCWAIKGETYFTKRHHRETPYLIENAKADVGIVWATEVAYAKKEGRKLEGVSIADKYNMGDRVGYAIGILKTGRNPYNASRYLSYLASDAAQNIYASYGFIKATTEDLILKAIPKK